MKIRRRHFLQGIAAGGAAAFGSAPFARSQGRSGTKYRTALIGSGWWGMNILGEAMRSKESKVVGLCDVDGRQLAPAAETVNKATGDTPKLYKDFRELLDAEKPEICIVATPDHWHALTMIACVNAGAHVYVEKPIGHTIKEGRAMVEAARKTGRVVQVGTHRRVSPHNVAGREFIRGGKLGRIGMVRAFVHYGGGPENPRRNIDPPKELDWDMWCGPAPLRPFNGALEMTNPWSGALHPRGWRNYLDYANGTLGDWGIHWMDQILWITGKKWPRHVFSRGGRPIKGPPVLTDDVQTTDAPDHRSPSLTSRTSPFRGNIASSPPTTPKKAKTLAVISTARRARFTWAGRKAGRSTRSTARNPSNTWNPHSTSPTTRTSGNSGPTSSMPSKTTANRSPTSPISTSRPMCHC
jgi:predicted dehydrogenase